MAFQVGGLWFARTEPAQTQATTVELIAPITAPTQSPTPRILKFTLARSSPDHLKVRRGNYSDQVLADWTRQQQQLTSQTTKVQLSLDRIIEAKGIADLSAFIYIRSLSGG
ncbi:MAG: hypothetical protein ACFBSG_16195 [Leptolyngbyaceae cyanobacterium]